MASAQYSSAVKIEIDYGEMLKLGCTSISDCIKKVLEVAIQLSLYVAIVLIIWSGFLFVTAMGDMTKLKKARSTLLWTIIGLAIIVGAWALSDAFQEFFIKGEEYAYPQTLF